MLTTLKADGWELVVTEASHRQLRHLKKVGRFTSAEKPNDDPPPGTLNTLNRRVCRNEERICYAIVVEMADSDQAAYVPDIPGRGDGANLGTDGTANRQAIELHLRGMREDGLPIRKVVSRVEYVEVPVCSRRAFWNRGNRDKRLTKGSSPTAKSVQRLNPMC